MFKWISKLFSKPSPKVISVVPKAKPVLSKEILKQKELTKAIQHSPSTFSVRIEQKDISEAVQTLENLTGEI